eukprot:889179-Prorocentrum_minimum.AAC.1
MLAGGPEHGECRPKHERLAVLHHMQVHSASQRKGGYRMASYYTGSLPISQLLYTRFDAALSSAVLHPAHLTRASSQTLTHTHTGCGAPAVPACGVWPSSRRNGRCEGDRGEHHTPASSIVASSLFVPCDATRSLLVEVRLYSRRSLCPSRWRSPCVHRRAPLQTKATARLLKCASHLHRSFAQSDGPTTRSTRASVVARPSVVVSSCRRQGLSQPKRPPRIVRSVGCAARAPVDFPAPLYTPSTPPPADFPAPLYAPSTPPPAVLCSNSSVQTMYNTP